MNNSKARQKKMIVNSYWPTAGRAVLFCVLCAVALVVSNSLMHGVRGLPGQVLTILIAFCIAVIVTKLFVLWEGITMKDVGVVPHKKSFSKYITGFGIGLFLAVLQPALILLTGHIKLVPTPGISFLTVITMFLLYLLLGLREEVAFRGFPLFSLNRTGGPWVALLIVGIIFIGEHIAGGMSWWAAILGVGTASLVFGFAALRSKGLALPLGLHSAWNFGQWTLGFKNEKGIFQPIIENGYEGRIEIIGWVCYMVVLGLAALALYISWQKDQTLKPGN